MHDGEAVPDVVGEHVGVEETGVVQVAAFLLLVDVKLAVDVSDLSLATEGANVAEAVLLVDWMFTSLREAERVGLEVAVTVAVLLMTAV